MNQLTACPANERLDIRTARPGLLEALDQRGRASVALKITRTHLDTGRYLAAGAALDAVPRDAILVAEGNSFKDHITGDTLTAMAMTDGLEMKDSARHVIDRVDVFVGNDATGADSSNGTPWVEAHQAANWIVERLDALTD